MGNPICSITKAMIRELLKKTPELTDKELKFVKEIENYDYLSEAQEKWLECIYDRVC